MNFYRYGFATVLLLSALFLSGCGESEMTIWLNPDGSGKATVKWTMASLFESNTEGSLLGTGPVGQTITKKVDKLVRESEGVDAWSDIELNRDDKGNNIFLGTAYFKDIRQFHLPPYHLGLSHGFQLNWQLLENRTGGRLEIRHRLNPAIPDWTTIPETKWRAISQDQLEEWQKEQRFLLALIPAFMSLQPAKMIVYLPGELDHVSNLKQTDDHGVELNLDPLDITESWIQVVKNDEMMARSLIVATNAKSESDEKLVISCTLAMAVADVEPYVATVKTVSKPWFNYADAVKKARAGEAAMWENLGKVNSFALPEVRPGVGVSLRGAIWHQELVADKAGRWKWEAPSCRVYVQAELAEAIDGTFKATIKKANDQGGQTLLSKAPLRLGFGQIKKSRDQRAVLLSVDLKAPLDGRSSVAEFEGVIEYMAKRARREIDLGFTELAPGATGARFGAKIAKVGRALWGRTSGETIAFALDRRSGLQVQGISLVTPDGRKQPCRSEIWYRSDEHGYEIMLSDGGNIPSKATLVLDVLDPPRNIEVPFAFTNIPIRVGMPGNFD